MAESVDMFLAEAKDMSTYYEIEVKESIRKVKIPKLSLQPFVENTIVHGFENVLIPCRFTVTTQVEIISGYFGLEAKKRDMVECNAKIGSAA